jgi:DNA-binding winged helix-turn-helix (wHTH) protein
LQSGKATVALTPREALLMELLVQTQGEVISYDTLYSDLLGRRFRGDTSNMRVLLAKLSCSARKVGLSLRNCIDVIPKTGYRYRGAESPDRAAKRPRATDTVRDVTKK